VSHETEDIAAMNHFVKTGLLIRQSDTNFVNQIKEEVEGIRVGKKSSHEPPYMIVYFPSGEGKTQLPFSFDFPVIYFLLTGNANAQAIYNNFKSVSTFLLKCAHSDQANIVHIDGYSVSSLEGSSLHLAAMIYKIMEKYKQAFFDHSGQFLSSKTLADLPSVYQGEYEMKRESCSKVRDKLHDMFNGKPPLVVLDEVPIDEDTLVRLVRNTFRALNIPCMLMGTNARLKNLTGNSIVSRADKETVWAVMLRRTARPCYLVDDDDFGLKHLSIPLQEFVQSWIKTSRPLFTLKTIELLKECEGKMDNICYHTKLSIFRPNF
jgi:hypothetical protein